MRESISNAFVFNLVLVFVGIMILLLVGSLSYSKAFKVKNHIINAIENNNGFTNKTVDEIEASLEKVGYRINTGNYQSCPRNEKCNLVNRTSNYRYCVYRCTTSRGDYYRAAAFMYFDIPLIDRTIEIPISGETKTFYDF